jgi:hypothetical protein
MAAFTFGENDAHVDPCSHQGCKEVTTLRCDNSCCLGKAFCADHEEPHLTQAILDDLGYEVGYFKGQHAEVVRLVRRLAERVFPNREAIQLLAEQFERTWAWQNEEDPALSPWNRDPSDV